jgi:redox-sensing transcriptional repressor
MTHPHVPDVVIRRLPLYLRCLTYLAERGEKVVSSTDLGNWIDITPAQIRKDLSYFGEFGRQGLGYEVAYLRDQLRAILHADCVWPVCLVGAGALGHALANYRAFEQWHYRIVAILDNDPAKIGQPIGNLTVEAMTSLRRIVAEHQLRIAILAVPASAAQQVAEQLVEAGVQALLNYAPINLLLPPQVRVANIDPVTSLQSLTFYL